ncbi:hypothetical protein N7U49_00250 [Streptomyces sp. AD2-2]|nr:hypothetical protein N7U49_00250 [Streptomyces sp. AD2-2]
MAIFGPQWTSGNTAELSDSDWSFVREPSSTSVALVDVDAGETGFTAAGTGGWKPEPGSEDLTLTSKDSSGATTNDLTRVTAFTLQDDEGTTTTFAKVDTAATRWQVSRTYLPTDASTTKVVSEKPSFHQHPRPSEVRHRAHIRGVRAHVRHHAVHEGR